MTLYFRRRKRSLKKKEARSWNRGSPCAADVGFLTLQRSMGGRCIKINVKILNHWIKGSGVRVLKAKFRIIKSRWEGLGGRICPPLRLPNPSSRFSVADSLCFKVVGTPFCVFQVWFRALRAFFPTRWLMRRVFFQNDNYIKGEEIPVYVCTHRCIYIYVRAKYIKLQGQS